MSLMNAEAASRSGFWEGMMAEGKTLKLEGISKGLWLALQCVVKTGFNTPVSSYPGSLGLICKT